MINRIVYAGHSAVFVHSGGQVAAIDPWLEGNPSCPDDLKNPGKLDLIVLTHGHGDHAGDTVRLQKMTGAAVCAIHELALLLVEEGIPAEKVIGMSKGGTATVGAFSVTLTHALHSSSFDTTQRGRQYAGEACGAILAAGGSVIYHAGDTALFGDLALIGELYRPSLALIPAGDHYTMGMAHAAIAARMLGVQKAIPIHHGTFPPITRDVSPFVKGCQDAGIEPLVLAPGEEAVP